MKGLNVIWLCLLTIYIFPQENNIKTITWDNPDGIEYQIDLYQNDTHIKTYQSNTDSLTLELPPGQYSYQLSFVNKFGRMTPLGSPEIFEIKSRITPMLKNRQSYEFYQKNPMPEITIELSDFIDGGRIYLLYDQEEIPLEYILTIEESYILYWQQEEKNAGEYNLVLENPDGTASRYDSFIRILPSPSPKVKNISPNTLDISQSYAELTISGENFTDLMVFRLYRSGGEEIPILYSRIDSSSEIHIWIELTEEYLGSCDLVITPPWDEIVEMKRALSINNSNARRNYYKDRTWGSDLLIGFPGQNLESSYNQIPSAEIQWRTDFALDSFILRQTGVILNMDYFTKDNESLLGFGGGLYYRTRFFIPVNMVFSGIFGIKYDKRWENGPYVQAQAALICQFNSFLIEPFVQAQRWYGATNNQDILSAGIRGGYRF